MCHRLARLIILLAVIPGWLGVFPSTSIAQFGHLPPKLQPRPGELPEFRILPEQQSPYEYADELENQTLLEDPLWGAAVYQSYRDGNWEIYLSSNLTHLHIRLTSDEAVDANPRVSPALDRIAFLSNRFAGNFEIFSMELDGSDLQRLTITPEDESDLAFSPSGNRIAFSYKVDDSWELFVINSDGSGRTQLTTDVSNDDIYPTWSPDGSKIAWIRYDAAGGAIWVMDSDGTNPVAITGYLSYLQHLAWSPDGEYLGFDADLDGDNWNELGRVKPDGSLLGSIFDPNQDMVDAWMGSWTGSSNGVVYSRVEFILYGGNYYINNAYVEKMRYGIIESRRLSDNPYNLNIDFNTIDHAPPITIPNPLPEYSPASGSVVRWSDIDVGPAPLASQHGQYMISDVGVWSDWFSGLSSGHMYLLAGEPGKKMTIRLRSVDQADNLSAWSIETPSTTLYKWRLDGLVLDNRGAPLPDIPIIVTPDAMNQPETSVDSVYAAYLLDSGSYTLDVDAPGYAVPAVVTVNVSDNSSQDLYLEPDTDLIQNGDFESDPASLPGWGIAGDLPVSVVTSNRSGGQYAASLGEVCPSTPCLGVPEFVSMDGFWSPNITADDDGVLHALWGQVYGGSYTGGVYYGKHYPGGGWSPPELVPGTELPNYGCYTPELEFGPSGELHAVWGCMNNNTSETKLFYSRLSTSGGWSTPFELAAGISPQLGVDSDGNVHVTYAVYGEYGLYYRERLSSGTWQSPQRLDQEAHSSLLLSVGADGSLHFVWYELSLQQTVYRRRLPDRSWSSDELIDKIGRPLSLLVEDNGTSHLIIDGTYYSRTPGGVWSLPETIDEAHDYAKLAVDDDGTLHLIGSSNWGGIIGKFYRNKRAGKSWSVPDKISAYSEPFFDILVDQQDRLHMVYSDSVVFTGFYYRGTRAASQEVVVYIQQPITIPDDATKPTLAWNFRLVSADSWLQTGIAITVTQGLTATRLFSTHTSLGWSFGWADLSQWAGKTVDVRFALEQAAGESYVQLLLDDISVGDWLTPQVESVTPDDISANEPLTVQINGQNFISTPTVKLGNVVASQVTWQDENTLYASFAGGLPPGLHTLWVTNPSGLAAVYTVKVGDIIYLPGQYK